MGNEDQIRWHIGPHCGLHLDGAKGIGDFGPLALGDIPIDRRMRIHKELRLEPAFSKWVDMPLAGLEELVFAHAHEHHEWVVRVGLRVVPEIGQGVGAAIAYTQLDASIQKCCGIRGAGRPLSPRVRPWATIRKHS